jgi:hypothetical protein
MYIVRHKTALPPTGGIFASGSPDYVGITLRQSSILCSDNFNGYHLLLLQLEVFVKESVAVMADCDVIG